jgi:hypothetical protein
MLFLLPWSDILLFIVSLLLKTILEGDQNAKKRCGSHGFIGGGWLRMDDLCECRPIDS